MIFSKEVYRSSGFVRSFFKRLTLIFIRSHFDNSFLFSNKYPSLIMDVKNLDIEALNNLCHVNAFFLNKSGAIVDISKCNSCGDCQKSDIIKLVEVDPKKLSKNSFLLRID